MTSDVLPYEKMKLRLLNASHQALCYSGMLLGYTYVHEAMDDADIRELVQHMMAIEVTPLLAKVQGIDLMEYKKSVIERFSNPSIRDQLARVGTEGSARIPKFVLASINEQLACGGPISLLTMTVASWFRYLTATNDAGQTMPINDPYGAQLHALALQGQADPRALLSLRELFGPLSDHPVFIARIEAALQLLYAKGVRAALHETLREYGN